MMTLVRYNLKIVAPTLLWTGILVFLLVGLILFASFRNPSDFSAAAAGSIAEPIIPVIAAFFAAGVLDWEMKRGAHELLRSKRRPLWQTVLYRLSVAVVLALLVGAAMLGALYFGVKRFPIGMVLLASVPPAVCLALVSLWTRIRFGNAFIGYTVALAVWLANLVTGTLGSALGIALNPLLTFTSYTDRLQAGAAGVLETTPYVDWWWVPKIALLLVAAGVFISITRRVENLDEGA